MKKFLVGLLVVVAVLAGLVYYQRKQVADQLSKLLGGTTYSSYGIKIQIPPGEASVKGWLRPYLNIPRLVLDLSAWGLETPLQVEGAVAFQDLWGHSGLILEVPRDWELSSSLVLSHPVFELGAGQSIKTLGAESVKILQQDKTYTVGGPKILLGPIEGILPDRWVFTLDTIQGPDFEVAGVELGLESQAEQGRRAWTLYGVGAGGVGSSAHEGTTSVGPWDFKVHGSIREMPFHQWWDSLQDLRQLTKTLKEKEKSEQFAQLDPLFDHLAKVLDELSPKLHEQEFSWNGLRVTGKDGEEKFLVKPLNLNSQLREREGDFLATAKGELSELTATWDDSGILTFQGLSFSQNAIYHQLTFEQLLEYTLDYYRALLHQTLEPSRNENFKPIILSSLAQYPNDADFNLKVAKLSYEDEGNRGEHQNLTLGFQMKNREVGYRLSDEFTITYPQEPERNITGGSLHFAWLFQVPWDGIVNLSRQAVSNPDMSLDFFDILGKQSTGFTLNLDLDLGSNYFALDTQSRLALPLGAALKGISLPKNYKDTEKLEKWGDEVWTKVLGTFIRDGYFLFDLKISRLSKFQKWLDNMKSGSSLGLALVAPYVIADSAADHLKVTLEFKNSEIWVNGRVNSTLQNLLQPILKEWDVSLPESQPESEPSI